MQSTRRDALHPALLDVNDGNLYLSRYVRPTGMQINETTIGQATVLSLTGDLDSFSCNYLKEHIGRLFDRAKFKLVIDLSSVPFVDSAGLGQLVGALKMCFHHGGNLVLVGANEAVHDLLRLTKLDSVFKVFDTVDEAAGSFGT